MAVGLVVLAAAGAAGAAAVTPAQKCQQAKNTEAGIYASCRQKVEAGAEPKGVESRVRAVRGG